MPLTRFVADALSVVTIFLVALLVLLGLFCIIYSFYFRSRVRSQNLIQLNYFSGPWIIRVVYIFLAVWWGVGEIIRLNLLRCSLTALTLKWQENLCKCYIVSNVGFAEPCLFLTSVFLLRASLQRTGTLSQKWNLKTAGFVLLYCFPLFILQLVVILVGPKYKTKLPSYFIKSNKWSDNDDVAICTYPLLSTIFLGLFTTVLTIYLFYLGRQILHSVINKGLRKRVYALIFSISSFFPLRVILLCLSILSKPENVMFDAMVFLAFLSFLCCVGVGICVLVYLPISDSLKSLTGDIEARIGHHDNDTVSLIANQSPVEGSISFRTTGKEETSGTEFVELSLFDLSQHWSPPGSPRRVGWPMIPFPAQDLGSLDDGDGRL